MLAVRIRAVGGPEVLEVCDLPEPEPVVRPGPSIRGSQPDHSGVWWEVYDAVRGTIFATIERHNFHSALLEKRRICAELGGRSGWCKLRQIQPD